LDCGEIALVGRLAAPNGRLLIALSDAPPVGIVPGKLELGLRITLNGSRVIARHRIAFVPRIGLAASEPAARHENMDDRFGLALLDLAGRLGLGFETEELRQA